MVGSASLAARVFWHDIDLSRTFLIVIFVFEVGSVICAAAPTSEVFIAGRAIAGFGSAGIFTGAMMIMIPMVPLHKRPMFQGESQVLILWLVMGEWWKI